MFNNLSIKTKILSGFLLVILFIVVFGIYVTNQLGEITVITRQVSEANELASEVLDFNVENFHTQLEVWEYAYDPNLERLQAFEEHNSTLSELLIILKEKVNKEDIEREVKGEISALYLGGKSAITKIVSNLEMVREDWKVSLFPAIKRTEEAKASGQDGGIIDELLVEQLTAVSDNEALFDKLNFNKEVDGFVVAQKALANSLSKLQEEKTSEFKNILFILIALIILLSIGVAMLISNSITKPLSKLQKGTDIVAKGDLNHKVGTEARDEVGQLSRSFDKMTIAIKESRTDIDKKIEAQTVDLVRQKSNADKARQDAEEINKAMVGRELKMIELKEEIENLKNNNQT